MRAALPPAPRQPRPGYEPMNGIFCVSKIALDESFAGIVTTAQKAAADIIIAPQLRP